MLQNQEVLFNNGVIQMYHFCILLAFLPLEAFASPVFRSFSAANPLVGATKSLGKPLIGDDGIIFACSGKNIYAFRGNGTIVWSVHLNYTCNLGIDLAYGGRTIIYLVAENRVLKVKSLNVGAHEQVVETFLDPRKENDEESEIIAVSSSIITSTVFVSIKKRGLYAYTFHGNLRWHLAPVVHSLGYRQSCRKNVTDCYFTSGPVIDQCEGSIYISNNQGELFSLSIHSLRLKWMQDFSSFDVALTVTSANNGRLYVTIPAKAVVFALAVSNGDILWQRPVGPLPSIDYKPVVDANGWISIGSLDGLVYSISPTGDVKKFAKGSPDSIVVQADPFLDCSGFAIYISQAEMEGKRSVVSADFTSVSALKPRNVFFTLMVPATGYVHWSETYPGVFSYNLSESDLKHFVLNEAIILAFIAASNVGNPLPCRTSQRIAPTCSEHRTKTLRVYTSNERSILLFLLFETIILIAMAIAARFCCIFWSKRKLQNQGLGQFLEKRRSLRLMKKEYDRSIKELEHKADANEEQLEASTGPESIEKLSDLVKEREGLKRKLSTTYSLGRDLPSEATTTAVQRSKSVLPLYDDGRSAGSYSFHSARNEDVTIFHGDADSECSCSSYEGEEIDVEDVKGKEIVEEVVSFSSSESYYADSDGECSGYKCGGSKPYD